MDLVEVLLALVLCALAGILFTARAILSQLRFDREIGHVRAIYQINEALHRLAGHEYDNLAPDILHRLDTINDIMSEIETSVSELRHALWRKSAFDDLP